MSSTMATTFGEQLMVQDWEQQVNGQMAEVDSHRRNENASGGPETDVVIPAERKTTMKDIEFRETRIDGRKLDEIREIICNTIQSI